MRTIIVGDVHGCAEELEALLERIAFTSGDRLVFVGDLVARGPDSLRVLDIARTTGALIVRGNHEQRLIDWFEGESRTDRGRDRGRRPSSKLHVELARALRPVDWSLLRSTKTLLSLPDHGLCVVHAGVDPTRPLSEQQDETLMNIRTVRVPPDKGRAAPVLWGTQYVGPPHIVFGHNAAPGLQLDPWATGLDTGCVYGGRLTALVLAHGQRIPRSIAQRRALLVSEPARRVWFTPTARRKPVRARRGPAFTG